MARKYAAEGCNVAINYVSSKDAAEELAAEVSGQYGVKAIAIQGVWFFSILRCLVSEDPLGVRGSAPPANAPGRL